MAMNSSTTAKRISSLFSLSKDTSSSNLSTPDNPRSRDPSQDRISTLNAATTKPLTTQRLSKHRATSSNPSKPVPPDPNSPDLQLPPILTGTGAARPASVQDHGSRPASWREANTSSREGSRSRPQTPANLHVPGSSDASRPATPSPAKLNKKRSWLPGRTEGTHSTERPNPESIAWISGLPDHMPYDLAPLLRGERVSDLWNESGDTLVYLFPQNAGRGPSFKVHSSLFAASSVMVELLQAAVDSTNPALAHQLEDALQSLSLRSSGNHNSRSSEDSRVSNYDSYSSPMAPKTTSADTQNKKHLYLPLNLDTDLSFPNSEIIGDDVQLMVVYRNFFAFLHGGALISTPRQMSLYSVFLDLSALLTRYAFSNSDGSSYGLVVANSFARYCVELGFADVRTSREKTIEAIVLGEHFRSWELYNEGFVHAVGKLFDMKKIESPKYSQISVVTRNRLERSSIDLEKRKREVEQKLENLDFPSMFTGIANSQTSIEAKLVRFKAWKTAFLNFRKYIISHYRHVYGAWPPKSRSKKHDFEESGLNRVLLQKMYQDFTDLYDILVDRASLTTRSMDLQPLSDDEESNSVSESIQHALRRMQSEYDRSTPPVLPPIPYDTPLFPAFAHSFNRTHAMIPNNSSMTTKRLKENEVNEVLLGSYNRENLKGTPWVKEFLDYERRNSRGKTVEEIVDMRCGQWLFIYAVLQSLPNVVVDARDLKYTEGVEYYLCIPSRGGRPWMKEDTSQSRSWYNVASGGGYVNLPADMIDHSVEGIYRRSHCWTVAAKWAQESGAISPTAQDSFGLLSPLTPVIGDLSNQSSPRVLANPSPRASPYLQPGSPASSGDGRQSSRIADRGSVYSGLEEVEAPLAHTSRPVSVLNPNLTFDSILGTPSSPLKKGKK